VLLEAAVRLLDSTGVQLAVAQDALDEVAGGWCNVAHDESFPGSLCLHSPPAIVPKASWRAPWMC